jgi:hypothetical protein
MVLFFNGGCNFWDGKVSIVVTLKTKCCKGEVQLPVVLSHSIENLCADRFHECVDDRTDLLESFWACFFWTVKWILEYVIKIFSIETRPTLRSALIMSPGWRLVTGFTIVSIFEPHRLGSLLT